MSFDPQTQVLIDPGVITAEQAQAAADAAPAPGEIVGIARCLNRDCGRYDEPRPIRLRSETILHRAPGLPMIESSTTHLSAFDDADLLCPVGEVQVTAVDGSVQAQMVGCGGPCAIQEHAPPVYQKMLVV